MLFIVSNQIAALIAQRHHIDILVLLFVIGCVYHIVVRAFPEPVEYIFDHLFLGRAMAVEQAPACQFRSAPTCVAVCGRRVHVDDFMCQVADYYRAAVRLYHSFEIRM